MCSNVLSLPDITHKTFGARLQAQFFPSHRNSGWDGGTVEGNDSNIFVGQEASPHINGSIAKARIPYFMTL
jgi:hypothetical protein